MTTNNYQNPAFTKARLVGEIDWDELPMQSTGVYRFTDPTGRTLYIGMATGRLGYRLKEHFKGGKDSWMDRKKLDNQLLKQKVLDGAFDPDEDWTDSKAILTEWLQDKTIQWTETETEVEARALEAELINRYRPSYN